MGTDFIPQTLNSGIDTTASLNTNFDNIQTALGRSLNVYGDSDASGTNALQTSLDVNSQRLLNGVDAVSDSEYATLRQLTAAGSTSTPDASVVTYSPSGTGAVDTTVQAKLRDVVSVKDFGAIGDGVTDDTVAMQAALDHCKMTLNSVQEVPSLYIPHGIYLISSNLTFISDLGEPASGRIHMFGDGKTQSTIKAGAGVTKVLEFDQVGNTVEWNHLHDFAIDGSLVADYGIEGPYFSHSIIERLHVYKCKTAMISIERAWGSRVRDCWLGQGGTDGLGGIGIDLAETGVGAGNANGFVFEGNTILTVDTGIKVSASTAVNIVGNIIEHCKVTGIYLGFQNWATRITGNYFENSCDTGKVFTTPSTTVKANIILNGSSTETTLGRNTPNKGIEIHGNYVINNASGGGADSFIHLVGATDTSIQNNTQSSAGTLMPLVGLDWATNVSAPIDVDISSHNTFTANFTGATSGALQFGTYGVTIESVNKQNIAQQDMNQWTNVNSGTAAGTFIRSAVEFSLGGERMPVWEVFHASSTTDQYGFTINAADFPEYHDKYFYFGVHAKASNTDSGPSIYVSATSLYNQVAVDTDWNCLSGIFKFPSSGTLGFGVGKWGTSSTTCQFAAPILCELGAGNENMFGTIENKYQFKGTAAPTAGTWKEGDTVWHSAPAVASPAAWTCTTAGAPGTWTAWANL